MSKLDSVATKHAVLQQRRKVKRSVKNGGRNLQHASQLRVAEQHIEVLVESEQVRRQAEPLARIDTIQNVHRHVQG